MKIAVFSNLWPPVFRGGYELGASHVVRELRRRGHEVLVLAAHEYHLAPSEGSYELVGHCPTDRAEIVDVGLCVFGSLLRYARRRKLGAIKDLAGAMWARRRYLRTLEAFQPDCLLAFNPAGVLAPVLDDFVGHARQTGAVVNCYVSDHWLAGWPAEHPVGSRLSRWRPLRLVGRAVAGLLRLAKLAPQSKPRADHFFYCSDFIRKISRQNEGAGATDHVAYWGVTDVGEHGVSAGHFQGAEPLTLVYAGQLLEHKGLGVLIDALPLCRARHPVVVIGDDRGDYADWCRRRAGELGVLGQLRFAGKKPPGDVRSLLARAGHVLVAPAVWEEPFSIGVLEGMGVGLPVVASDTGGTAEAIRDGDNGFLFPRGDFHELAAVLDRLEHDRALCHRIGSRARGSVLSHFRIERLVDQLEAAQLGPHDWASSPHAEHAGCLGPRSVPAT